MNIFFRFALFVTLCTFTFSSCNQQQSKNPYLPGGLNFNAETYTFPEDPLTSKFLMKNLDKDAPDSLDKGLIKYGYNLLASTSQYIGPDVKDKNMRFAGNNLACVNCHLNGGLNAWGGSWIGVMERYPKFRDKNGKINDIYLRIDGCFKRSMDGTPPPNESREMLAIVEYFKWLSSDTVINKMKQFKGYSKINLLNREADTLKGRKLFMVHCYVCHGTTGEGVFFDRYDHSKGFIYPRLWGDSTYNIGAGMAKLETFASFIKTNMPYGATSKDTHLSDEEAYDISGYVNVRPRPIPVGLENDFPNLTTKGADVPYGPYIDPFPLIQHRIGPLQPIKEYYKSHQEVNDSTKPGGKSDSQH